MARIKIDFVSDVMCPWCAVGLGALERAIEAVGPGPDLQLNFIPFELNPHMKHEGEDAVAHIMEKYGTSHKKVMANQRSITARGAEVGFTFNLEKRTHFYNSFDAHRLLHWAGLTGQQRELKHALLGAYFTDGLNVSNLDVLADVAASVGLERTAALAVLHSGSYAESVRALEKQYQSAGIHSVPAAILNDRYLISGGQPAAVFEQALRRLM